jgi:isopentenyldiphosphate isomerase
MHDEILDLVDENDTVIWKEKRSIVYQNGWNNFRVINGFLVNSKWQLWIPKRTSTKKIFPNALDMSIWGHVESWETYLEAFKREAAEELNLDIDSLKYSEIGFLTPTTHQVSAFMKVYVIKTDITPEYNSEDFSEYVWIFPEDLFKKIDEGVYTKGDLLKLLQYYIWQK